MRKLGLTVLIIFAFVISAFAQAVPTASPEQVGMSSARLHQVDGVIQREIDKKTIPGAVLLVARKGKIVYQKAYGYAEVVPKKRKMEADMIFDLASITKPVATATSIMKLVEMGKIRLLDKIKIYIPGFSRYLEPDGEYAPDVRLYNLLTHTSGLIPYANPKFVSRIYGTPTPTDSLVRYIAQLPKISAPGEAFHYSGLGYITMAAIIQELSGENVADFSHQYIFKPLGMTHTMYKPPKNILNKVVPTEVVNGIPFHGVVHDPLARLQGGISGNAGLFSSARDLFIFAQMLLNGGEYNGVRILSPLTVEKMTHIYPKTKFSGRGLGWDLASDYASNKGDLFSAESFGHTGYTGTSLVVDPATQTIVILLTNRVHPKDTGSVVQLRSLVSNVVAASILSE
ncbi:esterase EstB [bacterium BMS3Abin05]|nr:esterase EstB [bacterium BMS3Abin05]GBE26999.1 esterase EstB [bacterium BMS3Bbin03]